MIRRSLILGICIAVCSMSAAATEDSLPQPVRQSLLYRQLPHDTLSILVEDLDSGEVLARWHADEPRNPGSTIKLLTTLVALDVLGPTYTWYTDVYALGPVANGKLDGDLLLRGNGDPFLVTERVWQLTQRIQHAGIREISGDLLLDDSYFEVEGHDPAEFDGQPLRAYNVAPSALLMNFKVVRYWFEPNHATGGVSIRVEPALQNLEIDNRLTLAAGRCGGYQRGIAVTSNEAMDTTTFSGKFPSGCKRYAMDRAALSHREYAFGLFDSLWTASGGKLGGEWQLGKTSDGIEPVVRFPSLPLADVITRVNKYSNNVMARQLLHTLSAEVLGAPGTEAGGRKVVADWLQDKGLASSEFAFDNGAGLSREARMSAADFVAMLRFAWRQPYMPEYVSSMSIAGLDGTLRNRMDDGPLQGMARLKTGSLDHVAGIVGYLQARSGRRFAVVVMQNHSNVHRGTGEEVQEALLRWLYEQ